jgi:hypothetical protein
MTTYVIEYINGDKTRELTRDIAKLIIKFGRKDIMEVKANHA